MQFELTPAQRALQADARKLARGQIAERAAEIDRSEQYPWDNVALLREAGFFGMTIPAAYGGRGASYLDAVLVIEEVAKSCGITGRIIVEANMGAIGAIMTYGSEAQKRLAAELVLGGDKPAICITEPNAGSAASEMTTRADRHGNGFVSTAKSIGSPAAASRGCISSSRVYLTSGATRKASVDSLQFAKRRPGSRSVNASRLWAFVAFPRPRSFSRTWKSPQTRLSCRLAGSKRVLPI